MSLKLIQPVKSFSTGRAGLETGFAVTDGLNQNAELFVAPGTSAFQGLNSHTMHELNMALEIARIPKINKNKNNVNTYF